MGRIEAPPDQIIAAGGAVADVGRGLGSLPGAISGVSGAASDPPATASALETLAAEWAAGGARLREDVESMGELTEVSAMLYQQTDETAMGGADAGGDEVGGGGGGGGGAAW